MAKIRQLIAGRFIKCASLLVVGIMLLSGCIRSPEWTLFYFADQTAEVSQPAQHQYIKGYYDTLEQCQAKGAGLLRIQGISGNDKVDFVAFTTPDKGSFAIVAGIKLPMCAINAIKAICLI